MDEIPADSPLLEHATATRVRGTQVDPKTIAILEAIGNGQAQCWKCRSRAEVARRATEDNRIHPYCRACSDFESIERRIDFQRAVYKRKFGRYPEEAR